MVKGVEKFRAKLRDIPKDVKDEVILSMQRMADSIVDDMRAFNPLTDADIEINWTWGDAPKGAVKVGKVAGRAYDKISITIFAKGRGFAAMWFEFGTAERFHKSGKRTGAITARPFFFPVYRANKARAQKAIGAAVRRGFKKSA